jgi:anionic cell wall polymer biosynthesis LytR-Cps2A-Psr (LCP) family protein
MSTNLSFGNILALAKYGKSVSHIENLKLEGTDDMSTGAYYYELDDDSVEKVSNELKSHLELPGHPYDPDKEDSSQNDSNQDSQ